MPEWGVAQVLGQRESQQDSYASKPIGNALLALVADGMGGHAHGGLASATVARTFTEALERSAGTWPDRLKLALEAAQADLTSQFEVDDASRGAGTTVIAAVVEQGVVWHLSVGDSILALVENGIWRRLNADHSMLPLLERQQAEGLIGADELVSHPARSQLRSAIMAGGVPAIVDCPQEPALLAPGATLLLMSDGMAVLDSNELASIITGYANAQEAAAGATARVAALELPGQDNATLLVVRTSLPNGGKRVAGLLASVATGLALAGAWYLLT